MKHEIFKKVYHGFEDAVDLNRDISECLDIDFNPASEIIPGEFQGKLIVTIEYEDEP